MNVSAQEYVVLYHRGCNDGAAAAWCARERLGDRAIYREYQYGDVLPDCVEGKHLILVDLSLSMEMIEAITLSDYVQSVMVIDHHKTALPLERNLPEVTTFSEYERLLQYGVSEQAFQYVWMNHSGAVLSWLFFSDLTEHHFPDNDVMLAAMPEVLKYIEDYDLWIHQYPESQLVNRWLIDGGLSIDRIGEAMDQNNRLLPSVLEVGKAYDRYNQAIVKSVVRSYIQELTLATGERIAVLNAPHHLRNDIGDVLKEDYAFVVCYTQRSGWTVYSLRSKTYDVSVIAEQFGGGGHANSAAFSIPNGTDVLSPFKGHPSFIQRLRQAFKSLWS